MWLPELIFFFNDSLLNVIKLTQKIGGVVVIGSKSEIDILCLSNDWGQCVQFRTKALKKGINPFLLEQTKLQTYFSSLRWQLV